MSAAQNVYNELLAAGASTTEAIGMMANMINESSFNPEAVGDQGTSFGVVQEHGSFAYLVTGNATADLKKQIALLKSQGGFSDASGSTGAQAAGNFSANFERCVGCQPGGAQYNQRVANAATVEGWISSGHWPTSAGSPSSGGSPGSGSSAPVTTDNFLTDPFGSIFNDITNGLLKALGLPSLKDLMQRLGLILLGAALILVGIHLLSKGSSSPMAVASPPGGEKAAERGAGSEAIEAAAVAL